MLDLTSVDDALKTLLPATEVKMRAYKNNPVLAMLPKMESVEGRNIQVPIQYGTPRGRSSTFSKAKENKKPSKYEAFFLTLTRDYTMYDIDGLALKTTRGNAGAAIDLIANEIDSALFTGSRSVAMAIASDGTGVRGRIGAINSTTITLTLSDQIVNIEVGDELVAVDGSGAATAAARAGVATVATVNRAAGTFTVDAVPGTWSASSGGDYLINEGDEAGGGSIKMLSGIPAWLPTSTPSSTLFFGVDRTVDSTRLGGLRYAGTGETVEEAGISAATLCKREGAMPDVWVMNPVHLAQLIKEQGQRVQYNRVGSFDIPSIGFKSVKLVTPFGDVDVVADHNFVPGVSYMLKLDTWKLYSAGAAPHVLDYGDAGRWLRNSDSDSVEGRIASYAQLGCSNPGQNMVVTLAT